MFGEALMNRSRDTSLRCLGVSRGQVCLRSGINQRSLSEYRVLGVGSSTIPAMDQAPFMHRCLELAERGRGKVGTNPLVGAVLVRKDRIVAEAFHEGFGKRHAERALLEDFRGAVEPSDVLYVNLEPCCHQGKTPACTDIIRERGVRQVVFGMIDPDPLVAGKGIACLQKAGIAVAGPIERARCEWLNRGFVSLRTKGRPWVTVRRALTRDGKIAKPDGSPLKITSEEQDRWTHEWLRARHDAILVGVGTIVSDDPLLNTRLRPSPLRSAETTDGQARFIQGLPSPLRIVLDPHLRIPADACVINGECFSGTMIIAAADADKDKRRVLTEEGVRIAEVMLKDGCFDLPALWKVLTTPSGDFHGIASVLIEGGARTWEVFRKAGVVDQEVVLMGD